MELARHARRRAEAARILRGGAHLTPAGACDEPAITKLVAVCPHGGSNSRVSGHAARGRLPLVVGSRAVAVVITQRVGGTAVVEQEEAQAHTISLVVCEPCQTGWYTESCQSAQRWQRACALESCRWRRCMIRHFGPNRHGRNVRDRRIEAVIRIGTYDY